MLVFGAGSGGHDFGPSMRRYQAAKRVWKAARKREDSKLEGEARREMHLNELEMIAYGAPGVWCCAVVPFSATWRTIRDGRITTKMQGSRDELQRAGRWPIRG